MRIRSASTGSSSFVTTSHWTRPVFLCWWSRGSFALPLSVSSAKRSSWMEWRSWGECWHLQHVMSLSGVRKHGIFPEMSELSRSLHVAPVRKGRLYIDVPTTAWVFCVFMEPLSKCAACFDFWVLCVRVELIWTRLLWLGFLMYLFNTDNVHVGSCHVLGRADYHRKR